MRLRFGRIPGAVPVPHVCFVGARTTDFFYFAYMFMSKKDEETSRVRES
jgi:hypothetical protein